MFRLCEFNNVAFDVESRVETVYDVRSMVAASMSGLQGAQDMKTECEN